MNDTFVLKRATGWQALRAQGHRGGHVELGHLRDWIKARMDAKPDLTLDDLVPEIAEAHQGTVHVAHGFGQNLAVELGTTKMQQRLALFAVDLSRNVRDISRVQRIQQREQALRGSASKYHRGRHSCGQSFFISFADIR